ncbi:cytochrome c oxidase assembly factor Coa1 family protein [Pseudoxanthomonas beigongshangi]|uniref:cytochrome c oxidase assembly factor Coa1 family protein n=1 Tax=Pseudoxanthomonas beigongshangi TaxID=2782537 RepID=UPI00193C50C5|nr:cytochrome c oxidase assembly factor Coa1 family protein [Pseudoxanthomonas beigongshangi]
MSQIPVPPPNWWSRNWKWFVPTLVVTGMALVAAFILAIMSFVFSMMKSSEPYQTGLSRARADAAVVAALGEPITPGYFVQGNIDGSAASGEANLAIPLKGSRGAATLYVEASKRAGEWQYETLVVALDGGQRIDLRDEDDDAGEFGR